MRLVMNPEKMVIKEAQRTYTYLNLFGYATDLVICNRVFPENTDGYFVSWREAQVRYLEMIEEGFSPLPILKVPYFDQEVVGVPALRHMAQALFGDSDPSALYYQGQTYIIENSGDGYLLKIPLPFASREEVSLLRNGDDLTIQVGNWRRNLILPRALRGLKTGSAKFIDQVLNINFEIQQQEVDHE
jgi:arsenite-transporting ATPase